LRDEKPRAQKKQKAQKRKIRMLVSPLKLYEKAQKGGYAIGAFNTSDFSITKAIISAAEEMKSPVIIETSESEAAFLSPEVAHAEVTALAEEANIPVVLHLDHGKSMESVAAAITAGYTSVHIDGSALADTVNTALTKKVADYAHEKKIAVEGEIGHVAGSSEKHDIEIEIEKGSMTEPNEADKFVQETNIDVLAVAIGNIHGIYAKPPKLDIERLRGIRELTGIFYSLHGGSGITKNQIKSAIKNGVVKVNVNTELRMAFKQGILHEFNVHPDEVVPYKYLPAGTEAVKKVVEQKIRLFGSAGKA
jgi:ketose-bisphosphate aldolase